MVTHRVDPSSVQFTHVFQFEFSIGENTLTRQSKVVNTWVERGLEETLEETTGHFLGASGCRSETT